MAEQKRAVTQARLVSMEGKQLTEWDDFLIHQVPDVVDIMGYGTKEPQWCEHIWLGLIPPEEGKPFIANLFSIHPNTGYMHGFSLACIRNTQYNFRACRELAHDRANTEIGPLSLKYLKPLYSYRFSMSEAPNSQFTFNLELERRAAPQLWPMWEFQEEGEPFLSRWCHTTHSLRCTGGKISVAGKEFDASGYTAVKDHCWGIRGYKLGIFLHTWKWISFPEYTLELMYREDQDGKVTQDTAQIVWDNGKTEWLRDQEVKLAFERGTRNFTQAEWTFTDTAGKKRKLTTKNLYQGIYWEGGWSGEGSNDYTGPFRMESDVWELTREKQVELGKQTKEQLCRYSFDGDIGIGVFEHAVSRKHKKYGPSL